MKNTDRPDKGAWLILLVAHQPTRDSLFTLLQENKYTPLVMSHPEEVVRFLKGQRPATIFVDCEAVGIFGSGLYSRLKVASPLCRVILLCDKGHQSHQEVIREAMAMGAYACLLAPYNSWELLTMLKHSLPKKRK